MADVIGSNTSIKPKDMMEYRQWFGFNIQPGFDYEKYQEYYKIVAKSLHDQFVESPFWQNLTGELRDIDAKYKAEKEDYLFSNTDAPKVDIKKFDSFFNKSFRKNIIKNSSFPNPPRTGWVRDDNWFHVITDIVRTSFVVRYLDGVRFLTDEIGRIAKECGVFFSYEYVARDEGYYASHIRITRKEKLIKENWNTIDIDFSVEIQITTELQETIKGLLHKYYDQKRIQPVDKSYVWQWNYEDDQFKSNYLGHIAHYLEGMIVEIRDKQK